MKVFENREREIDYLTERYMRSCVEFSALIQRYDEADAAGWEGSNYFAESNLVSYHRFLAKRLWYYGSCDAENSCRALAVIDEIAATNWRFLERFGWGWPELKGVGTQTIAFRSSHAKRKVSDA